MAKIPFKVSARTARLIGRENIASSKGAIIELVKNGYDADSPLSLIYFHQPKDCLYIIDSGDGMTQSTIEKHWMTIGTDNNLNEDLDNDKSTQGAENQETSDKHAQGQGQGQSESETETTKQKLDDID
ncbi:hypothetical protein THERMOT_1644, partial [Bathymodiolus thermophilus thioautotrophic gill symbiont]|uniref:ATP-binding protein n=1 Tax=Bathymodiolus thermophilus thioautotrophic gill symbiont TaxID=2360 RepID=UPI00192B7906